MKETRESNNQSGNGEAQTAAPPQAQQPYMPYMLSNGVTAVDTSAAALERLAKKHACNGDKCDIQVIGSAPGGIKVGIITMATFGSNAIRTPVDPCLRECSTMNADGHRDEDGSSVAKDRPGSCAVAAAHAQSDAPAAAAAHYPQESGESVVGNGGRYPTPLLETPSEDKRPLSDSGGRAAAACAGGETGKAAKDKSRRLGDLRKGLMGMLRKGALVCQSSSAALPSDLPPPLQNVSVESKARETGGRAQQVGGQDDKAADALEVHRAKRRQRDDEPAHVGAAHQPLSPGMKCAKRSVFGSPPACDKPCCACVARACCNGTRVIAPRG